MKPMDMVNYALADKDSLIKDIEAIAAKNHLALRDAWLMVKESAVQRNKGWVALVADEQIQKEMNSVAGFMDMLGL